MNHIEEQVHKDEITLSTQLCQIVKWLKIAMALLIALAYLMSYSWLDEILILSVLACLILPLGFFDTFIQKLLEYNTRTLENRQKINAEEANEHFEKTFSKIEELTR